jgi:hypothetical protein
MNTTNFSISANGQCKTSNLVPDQQAITRMLASAKKKPQTNNTVIIARHKWLLKHKLSVPQNMELANLCLTIKEGKLIRAFYSNVLTHVIKKQNYIIQVLN